MQLPSAYGLHLPCRTRHLFPSGSITLELAGGQKIDARLQGLDWPEDHEAQIRLQSYVASLLFAADQLTVFLYSAMREDGQVDFTEQTERLAGRSPWPCRLYVDGRDVADYLREQRPEARAA